MARVLGEPCLLDKHDMKNGTGHWASTDTPFSSGCLTSLPHAHHAVAGLHRKAPEPSRPSLGVRAVGGEKLGFTPRTWTWLQVGLEGLRKGLKDLKLWARRPSGRLPSTSAGAPASHRCPPLWNMAGVLQKLPKLPASPTSQPPVLMDLLKIKSGRNKESTSRSQRE